MTNIKVLQIHVATSTFVPREPGAADGVQALVAFVENDSAPVTGQVWEELELTGLPWTVQTVQQNDGFASATTLSRPASEGDRLLAPGQRVDLVRHPVTQLRVDWRQPFQP